MTTLVLRRHKQGYLSYQLKGLLPASLMPRKTPSQWESDILSRHSLLLPESRRNAQVATLLPGFPPVLALPARFLRVRVRVLWHLQWMYVNVLKAREYYGCAFFPVSQGFTDALPKYVCIGVSGKGVYLLQNNNKVRCVQVCKCDAGGGPCTTVVGEEYCTGAHRRTSCGTSACPRWRAGASSRVKHSTTS